ncbi:MAG: hypothetical protein ABEH80_01930 [Halobaculum sp.]
MTGYTHVAQDGDHMVNWQPDDPQAALDALVAVGGTGVSSESDLPEDGLVDLSGKPDVRTAVREKHDELTSANTGGQTSGQ